MRAGRWGRVLAGVALLCLMPGLLRAEEASGEPEEDGGEVPRTVAVVSLDEGTEAGALMETVSEVLNRAEYEVVAGELLRKRLQRHQDGEVPQDVASRFAGIADEIGDGVKSFFYKGNQTAVRELTPIFDLGMGHPEVLVRRPDFAEQIFQAGIVLVRAHRNLGNDDKARAVAKQLVRTLPGREPSPSTAPPGTIRFFRDQREKLADRGTKIGVQPVGSDECTSYLNGTQVGQGMFVVAPGEPYYMRLECGKAAAPVWRATVEEGQHLTVPITSRSPLEYTMADADFTSRKTAENHLRLVQFWTDISRVIGIKRKTPGDSSDGVLVLRVDRNGRAAWSDTKQRGEIRRALSRVMPEYRPSGERVAPADGPSKAADSGGARWLDWVLVGGGAASLAGAGIGTVVTERRNKQVRCSPDTAAQPADCSGVPTLRLRSRSAIDEAESEVALARGLYIGGYVVGAGLATWGIWRLVRPEGGSKASAAVLVAPRAGGASAQLRFRW